LSARTWHLVCYDIRDDARLRKVARLLEGYGERLQYSVFRCRLTPREEERLRWELTRLALPEDAWMIVPLCSVCVRRVRRRDGEAAWPVEPPGFVVL
jgi:CRISPR-associated protein Cas2